MLYFVLLPLFPIHHSLQVAECTGRLGSHVKENLIHDGSYYSNYLTLFGST